MKRVEKRGEEGIIKKKNTGGDKRIIRRGP